MEYEIRHIVEYEEHLSIPEVKSQQCFLVPKRKLYTYSLPDIVQIVYLEVMMFLQKKIPKPEGMCNCYGYDYLTEEKDFLKERAPSEGLTYEEGVARARDRRKRWFPYYVNSHIEENYLGKEPSIITKIRRYVWLRALNLIPIPFTKHSNRLDWLYKEYVLYTIDPLDIHKPKTLQK